MAVGIRTAERENPSDLGMATQSITEVRQMSRWEYKLLDAGEWEFDYLHKVVSKLEGQGWRLQRVISTHDEAAALKLCFRRERAA